jgi:hypothetical protein
MTTGEVTNIAQAHATYGGSPVDSNEDTETVTMEAGTCIDDAIYAVHDEGLRTSQIYSVTPGTIAKACGPLHVGANFEGLESIGGKLYAVSSDTESSSWPTGALYVMDENCIPTLIGSTGFDVEGLALDGQGRPGASLWTRA